MPVEANLDTLNADDYRTARLAKEAPVAEEETPSETEEQEVEEAPESETVPESETGDETEEKEEEQPKKKSKGGFQSKIDKLTRIRYEQEARISQLEKEIAQRSSSAEAERKQAEPKKPKMEDFDTLDAYVDALTEFNTNQKVSEMRQKEAQEREQERLKSVYDDYNAKVRAAHEKYDDFDDVVGNPSIKIPQAVQMAVIEMENGPDVAYFLGSNPDICDELNDMSPMQSVLAVGRISQSLEKPSPKKKPASDAPAPLKPVSGSARSSVPLAEVSDADEYARRRRAELKARRAR